MKDLTSDQMCDCALDVVHSLKRQGFSKIEMEIILDLAKDRLRAERYYDLFKDETPQAVSK